MTIKNAWLTAVNRTVNYSKPFTLLTILVITGLLFIAWQVFLPVSSIASHAPLQEYTTLENFSTHLLLSLIAALLIIGIWTGSTHPAIPTTIGAALGMLFFIYVFGLRMVDPTQLAWLMRGDWQWQFLGWHIFRQEAWHVPLGRFTGFWYPVGTSVGYTDSIPLLAGLFKLFSARLPSDFQYFGLWLSSCFILQGIFAALLLRLLTKNLLLQALGVSLFVLYPILLYREVHISLCAHWLLLAGLWLYFKPWDNSSAYQPIKFWLLLVSISATTHPYLTVMVLGLATAFYTRWWLIEQRCTITLAGLQLVLLSVTIFFFWWLSGLFILGSQANMVAQPLGYYSMNLLAPFTPLGWSFFLQELPYATDGQYEGFNYLGAGVILLGVWAIYEVGKRPLAIVTFQKILPLAVVCISFTLLAVSNKITLGNHVLIEFQSDLWKILTPFQSSGRFFWPVNYTILFFICHLLITRNTTKMAIIYLSLGLIVQEIDLYAKHQTYRQRRWDTTLQTWNNPLKSAIWKIAAPHYQHITLVPPIACGEPAAPYQPFSYLAGHYGLTINTGQLARFDADKTGQYCQQLLKDLQQGKVEHNTIYVLHPSYLENFKKVTPLPLTCAKIDGFDICVTEQSYLQWKDDYVIAK
jgi:hypothetical protein